jgi:hypothetical protein
LEDTTNVTALLEYFQLVRELGEAHIVNSQWNELEALFAEAMPIAERAIERNPNYNLLRMQMVQMAWTRAQIMHKKGLHDVAVRFRRQTRDELRALASRGGALDEQMSVLLRKLEERG